MSDWWRPSPSREVPTVPWLSPEATAYLESILQPGFEIIEHGSGGSTLWMAQRAKHVTAYENDPDWLQAVKDASPQNVTMKARYKPSKAMYDLCLIDGEPVEDRRDWLAIALQIVRPGGWLVLDNANRPEYAAERAALPIAAELVITIDGNQTTRQVHTQYLVTDFWRVK